MKIRKSAKVLPLLSGMILTHATVGFGQPWTAPELLNASGGASAPYADVALDAMGNAVATWLQQPEIGTAPYSVVTSGVNGSTASIGATALSAPVVATTLYVPAVASTIYYSAPQVEVSASGSATAVWNDSNGIWYSDRLAGQSAWSASQQLSSAISPISFSMNSYGDELIVFTTSSALGVLPSNATVWSMRRVSGGRWTLPQSVGTGAHIVVSSATLSENGDAAVAWESYSIPTPCSPRGCPHANSLHVSRQLSSAESAWQDSVLTGRYYVTRAATMFNSYVVADALGETSVLFRDYTSLGYATEEQTGGSLGWTAAAQLFSLDPSRSRSIIGAKSDPSGNVTVLLSTTIYPSVLPPQTSTVIESITGDLVSNSWSAPVEIPGTANLVQRPKFAVGDKGNAIVAWTTADAVAGTISVNAAIRADAQSSWGPPTTLAKPSTSSSVLAVAMNASGNAAVLFGTINAASSWDIFATSY